MALVRSTNSSVFVGNLPYDAEEGELKEIFGRAGQVSSVRVVCDKDTKQPKGYAFVDFVDSASVQKAIDKLTGYEYNGRKLRIDASERELHTIRSGPSGGGGTNASGSSAPPLGRGGPPSLGPPTDPFPLPNPVTTIQDRMAQLREQEALEKAKAAASEAAERAEVARLMETLTPLQLLHLVGEMQRLAVSAPEVAKALVGENVQLALALQHAEFLVGMLEEPDLPTDVEVKERTKSVREKIWSSTGGVPPCVPKGPRVLQIGVPGMIGLPTFAPSPPAISHPGLRFLSTPPGSGPFPGQAYGQTPTATIQQRMTPYPVPALRPAAPAPVICSGGPIVPPLGGTAANRPAQLTGVLERLVQLSPAQIDELPHEQKLQLLEFLQTLPPA